MLSPFPPPPPPPSPFRLAKEKRERLRHAHLAPDYIPLHSITRTTAGAGGRAARGGRAGPSLVDDGAAGAAEGSGSDEEPEEMMRLKFTAEVSRCEQVWEGYLQV